MSQSSSAEPTSAPAPVPMPASDVQKIESEEYAVIWNFFIGGAGGVAFGLLLSLAIPTAEGPTVVSPWPILGCVLGAVAGCVSSIADPERPRRVGPAAFSGLRHLADWSIRLLVLAWLLTWVYANHAAMEKERKDRKEQGQEMKTPSRSM